MQTIYLDNNVVIDIKNKRKPNVVRKIYDLNRMEYRIVFSPAHVEEIADTFRIHNQSLERVEEKLDHLAVLTDSTVILPDRLKDNTNLIDDIGVYVYKENPRETYKRCMSYGNEDAEKVQKDRLLNAKNSEATDQTSAITANNSDATSRLKDEFSKELLDVLRMSYWVLRMFDEYVDRLPAIPPSSLSHLHFEYLGKHFPLFQIAIEKTMEKLEIIRYFPDKPESYVNGLHDTTHVIYAAYCDIFVTNDNKLHKKAEAAYQWLGVPTKILTADEFVEL